MSRTPQRVVLQMNRKRSEIRPVPAVVKTLPVEEEVLKPDIIDEINSKYINNVGNLVSQKLPYENMIPQLNEIITDYQTKLYEIYHKKGTSGQNKKNILEILKLLQV